MWLKHYPKNKYLESTTGTKVYVYLDKLFYYLKYIYTALAGYIWEKEQKFWNVEWQIFLFTLCIRLGKANLSNV